MKLKWITGHEEDFPRGEGRRHPRRQDTVFHLRKTQRLETQNLEEYPGDDNVNTF